MKIKNMRGFRKNWIKSHGIGKRLSEKEQDEISTNIKEFFQVVHGDKSNIESFLNKEINLTGEYQIIYELMQNAEDADANKLLVYYNDKYLLFVNNGKPFSEENIKSICNVGQSTKNQNITNNEKRYIGKFGIGFKLVYHLLGGVKQIMNYKAPIIFSWGRKEEIENFLSCNIFKNADVEHPVLFKPILTAVPIGINEKVYDLNNDEKVLFEEKEINELKKFIKEMDIEEKLKNFERGSLFFLELINKDNFEKNLREQINEIENSLIFLNCLKEVIINKKSFKKPENVKYIALKENNEKEIIFAYSPFNNILKDRPTFYCYFPIADEKHGLNFIINSPKFEIETSRRKLKGSSKDNINYEIIKESVRLIKSELEKRKENAKKTKNIKEFEELFYAILSSDEPKDRTIKELVYDELIDYVFKNIPCKDKNGNILFESKEKVVIKNTELDIYPEDFGINKYWFYTETKGFEKLIKDKGILERYSIVKLLKDVEVDFEKINGLIKKLDYETYLKIINELIENWSENKEFLDKIRKLKFILTESGDFACLEEGVYLPVEDSENLKIEGFNFICKRLLENGKIKKFFEEKLKIKELSEYDIILKGILSKYKNKTPEVSYEENIGDLKYIKENLNNLNEKDKDKILNEIKECYIIQVRDKNGKIKFSKPMNTYIPKEYSNDNSLEIYFYNYPANFVIGDYLTDKNDRKDWFEFLKKIGCNDKPILKYIIQICEINNYYDDYCSSKVEEEKERNEHYEIGHIYNEGKIKEIIKKRLKRDLYFNERSYYYYILCDWEIEGLENALNNIKNEKNIFEISKSIWKFLKDLLSKDKNYGLEGKYYWAYHGPKRISFESYIYTLLRENEWLPDENGIFRKPTELFIPSKENKYLLGDSVNYLHPDFKINPYSEKEFVKSIGVNLDASINNVLECLKNLSGKEIEFNRVIKLYNYIYSEILKRNYILEKVKEYFSNYPLIYIPKTKKWRKIDEVFWEDESIVFGDTKDYLVKYYNRNGEIKLFFEKIGVKLKADIPDYINAIVEISESVDGINDKIKKRIQRLYKKIWDDLKLDENSWEKYQDDLNKLRNGKYWLANKNGEYGFYYIDDIIVNDHSYYYELFKDKVPFWEFNKEFAKEFGVESLSKNIKISIKYGNKEEELKEWTNKLNEITPEIIKFILSKDGEKEKLENILKKLPKIKIWKTDRIFAEYKIKNETANDEIESYLDLENSILYISSDDDMPDLIGDAFEKYFIKYKIDNLREFIKDLMNTKNKEKILNKWCRRKGINFNTDVEKYFKITEDKEEDSNEENDDIDNYTSDKIMEDDIGNIKKTEKNYKIGNDDLEKEGINERLLDNKRDEDIFKKIRNLENNTKNYGKVDYGIIEIKEFNEISKKYNNESKLISKMDEKTWKSENLGDRKRLKNKISNEYDRKQKEKWNCAKDNENNIEYLKSGYGSKKTTKTQKLRKYFEDEEDNEYINRLIEEEFYSLESYSLEWFKKLIEIESTKSKRKFISNTLKITFYKVKKISNHLLELSSSDKPVPQFIEDFPNIRIYDENNNQIEYFAISVDKNKVKIKVKSINKEPKKITIEVEDLSYLLKTLKEKFDSLQCNIKEEILDTLNKIKIIYGPPGTGKTTKIVEDILKINDLDNKKILFLAPTNKAVDVFVRKIKDVADGKIEHLKQYNHIARELIDNKLIVRYKSTSDENIEDLTSGDINKANIVATTIAKISYDSTIRNYNPDILIIDESSMIPLPYIIYAILKFKDNLKNIWISGDPNQIQPVGFFEYWKEYNIYKMFNDLLGIDIHNITKNYENHFKGGYVRLTKQYRGIEPIGELFSRYAYNKVLEHYSKCEKPNYLSNITNSNICVIECDVKDDDRLKDVFKIEGSPINIYYAILATELALKIKEILKENELKKSIGIISPYKYQSHLIEGLISNQMEDDNNVEIYASTAHKFQGEECDIVIVVLNPPNTNNIGKNSLLNNKNLLNVAVSRARDYLFILLPNVNSNAENLNNLYEHIKHLEENVKIMDSGKLEKYLLNGKTIKSISFISIHGKINTYGKDIGVKYEIKLDRIDNKNLNSIDVFVNR